MKKWLFGALLPITLMVGLFLAVLLPAIFIGGFSGNSAYGDGFGLAGGME
ncbi:MULTISPECIES: hypothetical protein [Paenibacillus]|nr:hypothetical protein [Paenibacillus rhizosphaerae]